MQNFSLFVKNSLFAEKFKNFDMNWLAELQHYFHDWTSSSHILEDTVSTFLLIGVFAICLYGRPYQKILGVAIIKFMNFKTSPLEISIKFKLTSTWFLTH